MGVGGCPGLRSQLSAQAPTQVSNEPPPPLRAQAGSWREPGKNCQKQSPKSHIQYPPGKVQELTIGVLTLLHSLPPCSHADLGQRAPWPCTVVRWVPHLRTGQLP